jgi:hypothetical protein
MSADMRMPIGLKMGVAAITLVAQVVVAAHLAPALGAERFVVAMVMASLIGASLAWGSLRTGLAAIPGVLLVVPYVALTVWHSSELRTPVGQAEVILAPVLIMVMASIVLSTFPRSNARPTATKAQP